MRASRRWTEIFGFVQLVIVDMEEDKAALDSPGDSEARNWDTISSNLNDLCFHLNSKISNIKKSLQLRKIDQDPSLKTVLSKVVHEMFLLNSLLNKLEEECHHQKRLQKQLKDLQDSMERDYLEAQRLEENVPIYLPRATQGRYMKGRLTCSHVNAVIAEINKAVASKYSIMRQPLKTMANPTRNLYFRFQEEETKDTKGEYFIVEADIEEFTQLKADKRFHSILTILRHCHRVREIRGSRLVRYAIC
ncbi:spindle and kinetochore-associated protein 1 isoform X2 [Ahaetulla prasina]|uniref:spindle and kinetochore-associated protein 1 isoform X2 n=1 Tax=Ahaetulla prasina TaxID=499056 RepID=UPI002649ACB8|nr:spindle and kinetochore-associated protein 1 isoform X2 [Ahaetulla prasina]